LLGSYSVFQLGDISIFTHACLGTGISLACLVVPGSCFGWQVLNALGAFAREAGNHTRIVRVGRYPYFSPLRCSCLHDWTTYGKVTSIPVGGTVSSRTKHESSKDANGFSVSVDAPARGNCKYWLRRQKLWQTDIYQVDMYQTDRVKTVHQPSGSQTTQRIIYDGHPGCGIENMGEPMHRPNSSFESTIRRLHR
jgi:hypothetical protein